MASSWTFSWLILTSQLRRKSPLVSARSPLKLLALIEGVLANLVPWKSCFSFSPPSIVAFFARYCWYNPGFCTLSIFIICVLTPPVALKWVKTSWYSWDDVCRDTRWTTFPGGWGSQCVGRLLYFHAVIETRVEVWESKKLKWGSPYCSRCMAYAMIYDGVFEPFLVFHIQL